MTPPVFFKGPSPESIRLDEAKPEDFGKTEREASWSAGLLETNSPNQSTYLRTVEINRSQARRLAPGVESFLGRFQEAFTSNPRTASTSKASLAKKLGLASLALMPVLAYHAELLKWLAENHSLAELFKISSLFIFGMVKGTADKPPPIPPEQIEEAFSKFCGEPIKADQIDAAIKRFIGVTPELAIKKESRADIIQNSRYQFHDVSEIPGGFQGRIKLDGRGYTVAVEFLPVKIFDKTKNAMVETKIPRVRTLASFQQDNHSQTVAFTAGNSWTGKRLPASSSGGPRNKTKE